MIDNNKPAAKFYNYAARQNPFPYIPRAVLHNSHVVMEHFNVRHINLSTSLLLSQTLLLVGFILNVNVIWG